MRSYKYEAKLKCEISDEVIAKIESDTIEGLEEELYKLEKAKQNDGEEIDEDYDKWQKYTINRRLNL